MAIKSGKQRGSAQNRIRDVNKLKQRMIEV